MQDEERDRAYLWDMLDSAMAIEEFVSGKTYEAYLKNRMMRGAVERHVEIIGEAARRVSESTRLLHPQIPWKAIIGQRNVLAHEYDAIVNEAVWAIAAERIPELILMLKEILPGPPQSQ